MRRTKTWPDVRIIITCPKVSIDENDIPILVRNTASFEERHTRVNDNLSLTQYNKYLNNAQHHLTQSSIQSDLTIIIACNTASYKTDKKGYNCFNEQEDNLTVDVWSPLMGNYYMRK